MTGDVLAHVEVTLASTKADAARLYDRVEALKALRSLLFGFAAENNLRFMAPEAMWQFVETPEAEAELRSLIGRAFPPSEGDTDA